MSRSDYYSARLSGERLRRCYEIAPPAVCEYLAAELRFAAGLCRPSDRVLELGCGYGRALATLASSARRLVGIDTSLGSLAQARSRLWRPVLADAAALPFPCGVFDVVLCVQNGISAIHRDRELLVREALRVTSPTGRALFSTYAESFWRDRLEWFEIQSAHGLIGEIDRSATGDGVIACTDGFRSESVTPEELAALAASCGASCEVVEVAGSSLCAVFLPHEPGNARRRGISSLQ